MNTLARAQLGYDEDFEQALTTALTTVIVDTSMIDDCLVIRTSETAAAMMTVLASILALSPTAARSPTAIRKLAESFRKKLTARVSAAAADPLFADCRNRSRHDGDRERGGNA